MRQIWLKFLVWRLKVTRQRKQSIIAIICAVLAVIGVFAYTATIKSEAQIQRNAALQSYGGERTQVVMATTDIAVGSTIDSSNVKTVEWLVDLLPQGKVATSLDQVDKLIAQTDVKKNEPILMERVGSGTARISVPDGLEAVSVSTDDVLAVGGAISAGSFVDVYVETSESKIVLLGQKILVLETSNLKNSEGVELSWVTLAIKAESVSDLISASAKGTIHFVLPSTSASGKDKS